MQSPHGTVSSIQYGANLVIIKTFAIELNLDIN